MSRKGVTFEEKKTRMLQLFHEKKDFFQIKELEKIAPKEKGITQNSVKDVVQALVDDGSVDTDKVAGSIYYWSFPSKVINMKKRKGEELQNEFDSSKKKLRAVKQLVAEAEVTKRHTSLGHTFFYSFLSLEYARFFKRNAEYLRGN